MVTISIHEDVLQKLHQIAEHDGLTVEEALEALVEQSWQTTHTDPFEALIGIVDSGQSDNASRSREILDNEFPTTPLIFLP